MTPWTPADRPEDMTELAAAVGRVGVTLSRLDRRMFAATVTLQEFWDGPAGRAAWYRLSVAHHHVLAAAQAFSPDESLHTVVWVLRRYADALTAGRDLTAPLAPLVEQLDRVRRHGAAPPLPPEPVPPGTRLKVDLPGIHSAARQAEVVATVLDRAVIPQEIERRPGPAEPALRELYARVVADGAANIRRAAAGLHAHAAATRAFADVHATGGDRAVVQ